MWGGVGKRWPSLESAAVVLQVHKGNGMRLSYRTGWTGGLGAPRYVSIKMMDAEGRGSQTRRRCDKIQPSIYSTVTTAACSF